MSSIHRPHQNARSSTPTIGYPNRFPVPDEQVDWSVEMKIYEPSDFTAQNVLKKSPDTLDPLELGDKLGTRFTYEPHVSTGGIRIETTSGRPLNPRGRTGLRGRGKLYMWGPNQAADPIVTKTGMHGLEVLLIKRGDTGSWALPGGMVDSGEQAHQTARRELVEEALGGQEHEQLKHILDDIFNETARVVIFTGYVDDPRNTDNAWMETSAFHVHLSQKQANVIEKYLKAGDDAKQVKWITIDEATDEFNHLYANHKQLLLLAKPKSRY